MTQNGCQSATDGKMTRRHLELIRQQLGKQPGHQQTLQRIENQNQRSPAFANTASHIGRSNVPAADSADVDPFDDSGNKQSEWDRSHEVGTEQREHDRYQETGTQEGFCV